MTKLIIKMFIREREFSDKSNERAAYGALSGAVGVILNFLLFCIKLLIGTASNSIAITADAMNNLSDAGSSIINFAGFRISKKTADDEHPFGHGRFEYICALVISVFILVVGIELIKSSFNRITEPEAVIFSYISASALLVSIFGKIWLAVFNMKIGKIIHSPATSAVVTDSISDSIATFITLLSLVISKFSPIPIDGYLGIAVALFILYSGINILRATIGDLLGNAPDREYVDKIKNRILSYDGIEGVHDMIIHNYGPSRLLGSVHAEVPSNIDIMKSHDTIDMIERDIKKEFGVELVIHLDPIVMDDERISELKKMTLEYVKGIDLTLDIHDFRVVDGPNSTNLIFDLVTPHNYKYSKADLCEMVQNKLKSVDERYNTVITVEQSYVN